MAMLAERKTKIKYVLHPKCSNAINELNVGHKILKKMGWQSGEGLGLDKQGVKEPLRASYKNDVKGIGYKNNIDNEWLKVEDEFSYLLQNLSNDHSKNKSEGPIAVESIEEKSEMSKARLHYRKFTRNKDVSRYSEKDLSCILGPINSPDESVNESDPKFKNVGTFDTYFEQLTNLKKKQDKILKNESKRSDSFNFESTNKGIKFKKQKALTAQGLITEESNSNSDLKKKLSTVDHLIAKGKKITFDTYFEESTENKPEKILESKPEINDFLDSESTNPGIKSKKQKSCSSQKLNTKGESESNNDLSKSKKVSKEDQMTSDETIVTSDTCSEEFTKKRQEKTVKSIAERSDYIDSDSISKEIKSKKRKSRKTRELNAEGEFESNCEKKESRVPSTEDDVTSEEKKETYDTCFEELAKKKKEKAVKSTAEKSDCLDAESTLKAIKSEKRKSPKTRALNAEGEFESNCEKNKSRVPLTEDHITSEEKTETYDTCLEEKSVKSMVERNDCIDSESTFKEIKSKKRKSRKTQELSTEGEFESNCEKKKSRVTLTEDYISEEKKETCDTCFEESTKKKKEKAVKSTAEKSDCLDSESNFKEIKSKKRKSHKTRELNAEGEFESNCEKKKSKVPSTENDVTSEEKKETFDTCFEKSTKKKKEKGVKSTAEKSDCLDSESNFEEIKSNKRKSHKTRELNTEGEFESNCEKKKSKVPSTENDVTSEEKKETYDIYFKELTKKKKEKTVKSVAERNDCIDSESTFKEIKSKKRKSHKTQELNTEGEFESNCEKKKSRVTLTEDYMTSKEKIETFDTCFEESTKKKKEKCVKSTAEKSDCLDSESNFEEIKSKKRKSHKTRELNAEREFESNCEQKESRIPSTEDNMISEEKKPSDSSSEPSDNIINNASSNTPVMKMSNKKEKLLEILKKASMDNFEDSDTDDEAYNLKSSSCFKGSNFEKIPGYKCI